MKSFIVFFVFALLTINCYADSGQPKDNSDKWGQTGQTQTRYELMRTKARAHREFTNQGRVIYKYVDDSNLEQEEPHHIGNVYLDRNSRAREVYVGIDIGRGVYFNKGTHGNSLEIGSVESHQRGGHLKKVNVNVDLDKKVDFK